MGWPPERTLKMCIRDRQQWTSFKGLIHLPAAFKLVLSASKTDLTARELVWLCESAVLCSRGEIDTRTLPGEASYIAGGSYLSLIHI